MTRVPTEFEEHLGRDPLLLAAGRSMVDADIVGERARECVGLLRYLAQVANENGVSVDALIATYNAMHLTEELAALVDRLRDEPIEVAQAPGND